jgi:hypothetical protein
VCNPRSTPNAPPARAHADDLLAGLRRKAQAGDPAAAWLLKLLAQGEAAPPAEAGDKPDIRIG